MRLVGPPQPRSRFDTVTAALRFAAGGAEGLTLLDAQERATRLTYAELYRGARRVAAALQDRGILPGDRVALVLPTGADFLFAFFGVQLAGATPVPLYPPVRLGRMEEFVRSTARMLAAVSARMVLSDRRVKLLLGKAIDLARPPLGCPTVGELLRSHAEAEVPTEPEWLGLVQFSSGSTHDPKAVALTHRSLMAQVASLEQVLRPQTCGVSWLPLYHDMGLIGCLLSAVYHAGELVLLPPEAFLARPALWLRAISRHRATVSPAPNFAYGLCLKRVSDEELRGVDLSSWRCALNGAEPVSHETLQRFAARFAPYGLDAAALMPVYGLSEAALAVTFTPPRAEKVAARVDASALAARGAVTEGARAIVSVGTPVPGVEVEVRDGAGRPLAEDQVGRVFTRSASLMRCYYASPDATRAALVDGWLDTGDLGFLRRGELYVCGRAKDVVIVRGANHAPQEFEECLDSLPGVRTGCAVALGFVPPGAEGEQLLLLVERTAAAQPQLAESIATAVTHRTGVRPHTVVLLDPGALPRTSSGKLRRREALRRYLAGALAAPASVGPLSMGREVARSLWSHAATRLRAR